MSNEHKVAVFGLGSIGLRHAKNAIDLGWPVIGYDPAPARRALLEEAGGTATDDANKLLNKGWAGVIATPSGQHLSDLRRAVDAGLSLLVEKPMSHTVDGVSEVLQQAKEKDLVVAAVFNLRFRPVVSEAASILKSGKLGKILWARFICSSYLPEWRPGQDYRKGYASDPVSGGVIFDAIHEIDLANYLLGAASVRTAVSRQSGLLELESEDIADITLAHENGCVTSLHLDYVTRPRRRGFEICGENGLMSVDLVERQIVMWDHDDKIVLEKPVPSELNEEYVLVMKDFLSSVETGRKASCSGETALNVLEQACRARALSNLPS